MKEQARKMRTLSSPGRWASLRAVLALTKISLLDKFAYPHDMLGSLLRMFLEIAVFWRLWIALYGGREVHAGVTLTQALTYQVISVIAIRLFTNWITWDAARRIESGDVVFDVTRPMYYGHFLLFQSVGQAVTMLVTTSLPMFVLVCLIFRPALPSSALVWSFFGLSLGLGFLTSFYLDYIVALVGFWTTRVRGFVWVKDSVVSILGGTYLPLWIYPPILRQVLAFLPFRGVSYTPVAILVGAISLDRVAGAFAVQIAWLVLLAWASRGLYAAAMKRLAIQGG
jgi:ABC-2 type transport system permease protein